MASSRNPCVAIGLGIVAVLGVLTLPSTFAGAPTSPIASAPIPDPPPLPCKMQSWWNADRVCLSWTAPRDMGRDAVGLDRADHETLASR
jgi:hypothetical protein